MIRRYQRLWRTTITFVTVLLVSLVTIFSYEYTFNHFNTVQKIYFVFGHPKFVIVNPLDNLSACQQRIQFSKRQTVDKTVRSISDLEKSFGNLSLSGGHFRPAGCFSEERTAIIIPYRNRERHLLQFLNNVLPKLLRQKIDFTIFIIEQAEGSGFNRGMLSNIGFTEAMKSARFDCVIFNDVDTIIEDDRNIYQCSPNMVRHQISSTDIDGYWLMPFNNDSKTNQIGLAIHENRNLKTGTYLCPSVIIPILKYPLRNRLPYHTFVGGIIAFTANQYRRIHGYSNLFFLWGGEDDDLYRRIVDDGFTIERPPDPIGAVTKLTHAEEKKNEDRRALLATVDGNPMNEGLTNLDYKVLDYKLHKLFTWITVDLDEDAIKTRGGIL